MNTTAQRPMRNRQATAALVAATIVAATGGIVLLESFQLHSGVGFSPIRPALFEQIVGATLLAAALMLVIEGIRGHGVRLQASSPRWRQLGLSLAVLTGFAATINLLGFPLAVALMLPLIARLSGSRRTIRDVVVGFCLGITVYLIIGVLLGVRMPGGPFGILFQA